ncbi:polysaccharide deacetylase family protein [Paenibacillus sp. HJGM_3]|uniref:polysaccharide deacetylase family protein n=1 Tax=Paenibacillus sp. HJGM_3 TaxID=3379816 RepID=UPI00385CEE86
MLRKWAIAGAAVMLLTWGLYRSDNLSAFITSAKQKETIAYQYMQVPDSIGELSQAAHGVPNVPGESKTMAETHAKLYERIQQLAEQMKKPPIDAKLDKVWKAVPALNGQEVDIDATWRNAIQLSAAKAEAYPLIYKPIPPSVRLEDLGAQPIYKGNPEKPMVALMINVAWGNEFLSPMLDVLERQQVKATFFLDGSWLSKNEDLAKMIASKGHELSNHAYSHKNMSQISRQQNVDEIAKTQALLEKMGVKNHLFAPPSGDYNDQTVKVAHELGLHTILWTLDTVDWKNPGADTILRRLTPRLEPGATILMHPTASSSGALNSLIESIKKKGLVLGTVSELISPERIPSVEEPIKF